VVSAWLTHRGTSRVLLRLVTAAAGGLWGAGGGSGGAHQMEHVVLILLETQTQSVIKTQRTACSKRRTKCELYGHFVII